MFVAASNVEIAFTTDSILNPLTLKVNALSGHNGGRAESFSRACNIMSQSNVYLFEIRLLSDKWSFDCRS